LKVRTCTIDQVVVLDVAGLLGEINENLDRAIQLALAEGPRGVVCDLSSLLEGIEPGAVEILAAAGRHVRDWPAVPVVVACPDPRLREELLTHPLGRHLIVTESTSSAISAVLATPVLIVERLRLAPNPRAPRASRDFVARILKDWQLDRVIPFASVVVSRLVAASSLNAGTAIDLSVAWNAGALRLTVRDHGPARPSQRLPDPGPARARAHRRRGDPLTHLRSATHRRRRQGRLGCPGCPRPAAPCDQQQDAHRQRESLKNAIAIAFPRQDPETAPAQ